MATANNVLIALINSKTDFEIAKSKNWYRIPVASAPLIVKDDKIQIIAFYHTKEFAFEKYSICYYAVVTKISIVKRKELFPNEAENFKTNNNYYKIEFLPLLQLENPIISKRCRRILFIPTTKEKFFKATEINHLFNDSVLEDLLWEKFVEKHIAAERQFYYKVAEKHSFILDFAIFCRIRNINIECDGDKYHLGKPEVQYDKNRNNYLESKGWSVLRFTTKNLTKQIDDTVNVVCDTINKYGGVQDIVDMDNYHYIRNDKDTQLFLFD
jgi:very-short-patch-repair endonuclease